MNIKTRCLAGMIALIIMLSACGKSDEKTENSIPGSRANPLLPGDIVTFDGMDSGADWAEYVADITYLDAIRGEEAMKIFLSGGYYATTELIPENQELIIVKMTLNVRETKNDSTVLLGDDRTPFFQAVSGSGVSYEPFFERLYISQNLFSNMYSDSEQTAHRFFLVDKDDADPLMVIHSDINGGIWFKLNIDDNQRTDQRIDISEWTSATVLPNNDEFSLFKVDGDFAGTLRDPLPMGYWGLYYGDEYTLNQILEMRMETVERGIEAAQRLLSTCTWIDAQLTDSQEVMAVLLSMNVLHTQNDTGVEFFGHNFEMLKPDGQSVAVNMIMHDSTVGMPTAFPGASCAGWVFFVVEKEDKDLILSPSSFSAGRLWMSTDPNAVLPSGKDAYMPQYTSSIGAYDAEEPLGSMRHPIPVGDIGGQVVDDYVNYFDARLKVLEVVRGEAVKKYMSEYDGDYVGRNLPSEYELVSVSVEISVTESKDDQPVDFNYFLSLADNDHMLCRGTLSSVSYDDSFINMYPETPTVGRIIFIVDKDSKGLFLRLSSSLYESATWFALPDPTTDSSYDTPNDEASDPAERLTKTMTDEQLRGLAFGAVLATRNRLDFEHLAGFPEDDIFAELNVEGIRTSMTGDWGITNHDEAIVILDRLVNGLHHRASESGPGYDYLFAIGTGKLTMTDQEKLYYRNLITACDVVTNTLINDFGYTSEELERITTVSAWDYDRLVHVARMSYAVGWISEDEAWSYIYKAVEIGVADYEDWRGYFAGVMYGRAIWSGDMSFSYDNTYIAKELLLSIDSIYKTVPFRSAKHDLV